MKLSLERVSKITPTSLTIIAKPLYGSSFVFENLNLVSVNMGKSTILLDKPIFLGQAILDISKEHMFEFHLQLCKTKMGREFSVTFHLHGLVML